MGARGIHEEHVGRKTLVVKTLPCCTGSSLMSYSLVLGDCLHCPRSTMEIWATKKSCNHWALLEVTTSLCELSGTIFNRKTFFSLRKI